MIISLSREGQTTLMLFGSSRERAWAQQQAQEYGISLGFRVQGKLDIMTLIEIATFFSVLWLTKNWEGKKYYILYIVISQPKGLSSNWLL